MSIWWSQSNFVPRKKLGNDLLSQISVSKALNGSLEIVPATDGGQNLDYQEARDVGIVTRLL